MNINLNYFNKLSRQTNPWRDWNYLLIAFFGLIILVVILNFFLNWYIKITIDQAAKNISPTTTTIDQKALTKILNLIALRELEHQTILAKPKTFSDPSL